VNDGSAERAARLFGAVTVFLKPLGLEIDNFILQAEQTGHRDHQSVVAESKAVLGDASYLNAFQAGARLTQNEALALALGTTPEPSPSSPGDSMVLTRREQQIAALLAYGLSNKDIAGRLTISQRTAETHVANILTKLGCTSRAQVAVWMTEHQHAAALSGDD
jgi:non-specific serine/threonine protein kinase